MYKKVNIIIQKSNVFKRWMNKSYAVFSTLNRCVKIGVLSASYVLAYSPTVIHAQSIGSQLQEHQIEEVEVSASAPPDVFTQVGRTVTQLQKVEIERAATQSLVDVLKFVPNIDLRQRGPLGAQANLSIRGSSFEQTIVLLNGINLGDPNTGHHTLKLPVDIESIERIEILEGAAARFLGNNAVGGAVNFITKTASENNLIVSMAGGQYGYLRRSFTGNHHNKYTTHHLSVSKTTSDGYMHNTAFEGHNLFSHNRWNNAIAPIDLQLGFSHNDTGANSYYGASSQDQHELANTFLGSLKSEFAVGGIIITPSVYWKRNYSRYIWDPASSVPTNFHCTDVQGTNIMAAYNYRINTNILGKTSVGLQARNDLIYSSNRGRPDRPFSKKILSPHQKYLHSHGGGREFLYDKTDRRINYGAFLEQNVYVGKWSMSAGALLNRNTYTRNRYNIYPGIEIAFRPDNSTKIYACANSSMRLPSFTELSINTVNHIGPIHIDSLPNYLKPERSREYELGIVRTRGIWKANVNYFYRHIHDAIDWKVRQTYPNGSNQFMSSNFSNLYTHGISFGVLLDAQNIQLSVGYAYLHTKKSGTDDPYYLMDYLKDCFTVGFTHTVVEKIKAHWSIRWQNRNGSYLKLDRDTNISTLTDYKAFWQTDLRIYRKVDNVNVFIEASNLDNKQHYDIGNILLPGRWIRAGISVELKYQGNK
jgi:iron complex outermembrane receptor protein